MKCCLYCKKDFQPNRSWQFYCSTECKNKFLYWKNREEYIEKAKKSLNKAIKNNPNYWKEKWLKRKRSDARVKYRAVYNKKAREHYKKLRLEGIKRYGNECKCCGEKIIEFLSIDHIDGGGNKHRKQIRSNMWQWLKNNNYPKGFQVLCFNCNCSKGFHGYCPHKV